ncbi:MAG: helix-turn-helix domain-containing protein [Sandaracinaceae bacterium]|nr:helix-turn-helix domain-containing protein [Sandaracinaceae bacterium]
MRRRSGCAWRGGGTVSGPCDERVLVEITKTNELLDALLSELRRLRADTRPPEPEEPLLLSPREFARLIGISDRTFRRMRAEPGVLPRCVMIAGKPRWKRADVDAWVASRKSR